MDQRGRAQQEARTASATGLAAAAVANLEADPELSVLLAMEAVEATRSVDGTVTREAEEALHRAVVASRLESQFPGMGGLLAWSPRGVFVTEGAEGSGMIDIRDSETGESVLSFQGHRGDVTDVTFSPDGSKLASTGIDGKLRVWDSSTGRLLSYLAAYGVASGPSFSANWALVSAAWSTDGARVQILDLSTDQVVSAIPVDGAIDTALSPNGRQVAVGITAVDESLDEVGAVFDVNTGQEVFVMAGPNGSYHPGYRGVAWSPNGELIAANSEGTARVWDAETGTVRHTLFGHNSYTASPGAPIPLA